MPRPFPRELQLMHHLVEWFMTERFDLRPFFQNSDGTHSNVHFELCDPYELYRLAAYGGFPHRYPHYRFGLEFHELISGHDYGTSKIYEMVINNKPVYAYLLFGNSLTDQMLVMTHVYGHADFFVNNFCFQGTNRRAVEMMANHAVRIEGYVERYGLEVVEQFIDHCLTIDNLIDPYGKDHPLDSSSQEIVLNSSSEDVEDTSEWSGRFPVDHEYLDSFVNPPDEVKKQQDVNKRARKEKEDKEREVIFPPRPVRDIMKFIADNGPLLSWQRDVLSIVREEAYYFHPQGRTKIMNEGWASYWHSRGMMGLMSPDAVIDYAEHNAGTVATSPGRINPYFLGREIFRDIFWRWNTHRHGKIYSECDEQYVLEFWDQFVAFKNILDSSNRGECGLHQKWNEFLCFWRAIKALPLANVIYEDKERLLWWWDYYCRLDEKMKINTRDMNHCSRQLNDCSIELAVNAQGIDREKVMLRQEFFCDHLLPRLRGLQSFLDDLSRIRDDFRANRLIPEDFVIPDAFFDYARRFSRESLVIADGQRKIFEVRKLYEDVTFIDSFLTLDVALRTQLFTFDYNEETNYYEIASRDFDAVKKRLCSMLANGRQPLIELIDANFDNAGEMLLHHRFSGIELQYDPDAQGTLESLFALWNRTVHIDTAFTDSVDDSDSTLTRLSYDGEEHSSEEITSNNSNNPSSTVVYF